MFVLEAGWERAVFGSEQYFAHAAFVAATFAKKFCDGNIEGGSGGLWKRFRRAPNMEVILMVKRRENTTEDSRCDFDGLRVSHHLSPTKASCPNVWKTQLALC